MTGLNLVPPGNNKYFQIPSYRKLVAVSPTKGSIKGDVCTDLNPGNLFAGIPMHRNLDEDRLTSVD